MNSPLQNGDFLIAILKSSDAQTSQYALQNILQTSSYLWTFYIDAVETIKGAAIKHPELSQLVAFCLSKIYFYANDHQAALHWAVHADQLLNISDRSLYTDTIISLIFSTYTWYKSGGAKSHTMASLPDSITPEMIARMEPIILNVLESSARQKLELDKKIIVGLTIETQNIDLLKKTLSALSSEDLTKTFEFSLPNFENKQVGPLIYEAFLEEFSKKQSRDYLSISRCLFSLGQSDKHAEMLVEMTRAGSVELAYQIAADLNESGSLYYCNRLADSVTAKLGVAGKNLVSLLNGDFKRHVYQLFLTQNSNVDVPFLKNILNRWKPKESYNNNSMAMAIGMLLSNTQSTVHLKDYIKSFAALKNWSLFTVAASLGLVFSNRKGFQSEAKELTINERSHYATGGFMYATGLSNFGNTHREDLREANLANIKSTNEPVAHGAIMALGLQNALSNDEVLVDHLKTILFSEKAVPGEAAGYALNLVKATHYSSDHVEEMINLCQNNPHDKIARAAIGTIGLTAINSTADVSADYAKMINNKDPHIRLGAVGLIALRHFATAHSETVNELLRLAATDLSNDVRRMAVIGLAFVMIRKRPKAYLLLKLLSVSYNPYIRHAVALSLGILYAHSFDKKVSKLLTKMIDDKVDYVRQAASIGLGLVFQLGSENLDQNFEAARTALSERANKKHETSLAKFGHILGLALMQPGGENSIINLNRSESWNASNAKPQALIGIFLFTFYWYWYPMGLCLGLALEPTCLVGISQDLRVPRGFQFYLRANKKTFDYYRTPESTEQKSAEVTTAVLSTTKRAKARIKKQAIATNEKESPDRGMIIEDQKPEEGIPAELKSDDKKVLLSNPQRILKKQTNFIDFNVDNRRYQPVIENRKIGILMLKDLRSNEQETYADELPKEAWLVPPPEFKFEATPKK